MTTSPSTVQPVSSWTEPSFIASVVSAVGLALSLVLGVINRLDPTLSVIVVLALFVVFIVSLLYRQNRLDAQRLAIHKADLEAEENKIWQQQTGPSYDSVRTQAKLEGIMLVEDMLAEVLREPGLPQTKREACEDVLKRVRDMERGASPWRPRGMPFPIREQIERAQQAQQTQQAREKTEAKE